MSARDEYIDKLESQLKDWNKQIDDLQKRVNKQSKDIQKNFSRRSKDLKKKRDALQKKLTKIKESGGDAFDRLKGDSEVMWKDIKEGIADIKAIMK